MSDKKILIIILLATILTFGKMLALLQSPSNWKNVSHNSKVFGLNLEDYAVRVDETFLDITNIDGMPKHYFHCSSSISAK